MSDSELLEKLKDEIEMNYHFYKGLDESELNDVGYGRLKAYSKLRQIIKIEEDSQ